MKTPGKGRAAVTHFHGEASVPSMDGWADQFFCNGETKVIRDAALHDGVIIVRLSSLLGCSLRNKQSIGTDTLPVPDQFNPNYAALSQDYIIPNNRHATLFYHDHSVGITSENVYAGERLVFQP